MKKLSLILLLGLVFLCRVKAQGTAYTTNFTLTENPISESGRWINGQAVGLDWKNVRTTPGLAFGADASGNPNYNDPTALLTGSWSPNQTVQATVRSVNQQSGKVYEEVELRLRSTITAHSITGYEVLFRCNHDDSWYTDIVRWNGPLGNFTILRHVTSGPGIFNGDVVKATIVGSTITAYINGVQVNQVTDSTFANGNPGMGFYLHGIANANADFGFTTFTASDTPSTPVSGGGAIRRPVPVRLGGAGTSEQAFMSLTLYALSLNR
jgi:hypothetical protein